MAVKKTRFIACTCMTLPPGERAAAAATAVNENPANAPPDEMVAALCDASVLTDVPQFIAVATNKYWGVKGRDFGVTFLDGGSTGMRSKVLAHMNAWADRCNVSFRESSQGDIRITRGNSGYWSYLGTDILSIRSDKPTMNLQGFTENTSDSEYKRVVRHECGHCLTGDTLIDCPRDLTKYPSGIPIRDLVGQQPWVYAWKDGLVIRKASRVWLSRVAAPIVRVTFRSGPGRKTRKYLPPQELTGTADHPVLLSDGTTWKKLGDLTAGDRVCSMYRQSGGARSTITWTGQPDRVREHVFVNEQVHGPRPSGHESHHKNENKLDQTPENLEWKSEFDHRSDHSRGRVDSAETREKRVAANVGRVHTAETRAKMSASQRSKAPASAETRAKISAASKGRAQSAETIAKRTAAVNAFYASGGRSGMLGKTASEETRKKRSEAMKTTLARKRAAKAEQNVVNHVVVSVEPAGFADVYDMTVPDASCFVANGVVVHNSLGCPHEHMRRAIIELLDVAKTINYFRQTQGWSQTTTIQQVLTPVEESSILGSPTTDQDSIMCYSLPGSITKTGKPIVGGTDITENDYAFMSKLYPKVVAPPPPPPPPPAADVVNVPSKVTDVVAALKALGYTVTK